MHCIRRPPAVQAQSHLNTQLPNADTIDFFFWSEKKGGSSAPSEPPLATCLAGVTDSATWQAEMNGVFFVRYRAEENLSNRVCVRACVRSFVFAEELIEGQ